MPRRRSECSSTLIFPGLFRFPYLPVSHESHLIRKYTPSLLSCLLKFLFFNLHFSKSLSFSLVPLHRDVLHIFSNHSSLDLLILSIYLISPFFISSSSSRRRFSLLTRPIFYLTPATSRLYIYSPFIHLMRVALPYQSFFLILSPSTLPISPQQICTLLYSHLRRVECFIRLSHRCYARREYPSTHRKDVIYSSDECVRMFTNLLGIRMTM